VPGAFTVPAANARLRAMRGALVVLEGIDQAGKMTQARALQDAARAAHLGCEVLHYPDYETPVGRLIESFLCGGVPMSMRARAMLFAANRWEKDAGLRESCERNALVCVDRYSASNIVYGLSQGAGEAWLASLEDGLLPADLTVLVDIDPDESRRRKAEARDDYERNAPLLREARARYRAMAARDGWVVLDGSQDSARVTHGLIRAVRDRLAPQFPALAGLELP